MIDTQQLSNDLDLLTERFNKHSHTGNDNLQVSPADLLNAQVYTLVRSFTLTSAQVLALFTTPITIIPAAGTNAFIVVEGISAQLKFNTVAYTGANNLEFRYTGAAGTKVTADLANTFINSGASAIAHVAGIITAFTPVVNTPIVVCVPTANPGGGGNSSIKFVIKYRVISF